MKNFVKIFGMIALIAVIGFALVGCDNGSGGGGGPGEGGKSTITITGITGLPPRDLYVYGYTYDEPELDFCVDGSFAEGFYKLAKISNGKVTMSVFDSSSTKYTGDAGFAIGDICFDVFSVETITEDTEEDDFITSYITTIPVSFSGGEAVSIDFSDLEVED